LTEEQLKLEARLTAIEYMIGHAYSRILVMLKTTDEQMDQMEAQAKLSLGQTTLPGVDPAMADHFSAEIQEAIEHLLLVTREMRDVTNAKLSR
jgi:hypothetical protein